jgi:hypothetical protein
MFLLSLLWGNVVVMRCLCACVDVRQRLLYRVWANPTDSSHCCLYSMASVNITSFGLLNHLRSRTYRYCVLVGVFDGENNFLNLSSLDESNFILE